MHTYIHTYLVEVVLWDIIHTYIQYTRYTDAYIHTDGKQSSGAAFTASKYVSCVRYVCTYLGRAKWYPVFGPEMDM